MARLQETPGMWNLACPCCSRPAVTWITKIRLGPLRSAPCLACGKPVGVAAIPLLMGVFLFVSYVLASSMPEGPFRDARVAGATFGTIVVAWGLWFARAPLVKREE